ncbi:uncharacterized protein LOC115444346 [Manduca sexta]|uniref:Uncharacterized protein n=1 Tax=Manduca sexta TaxID=7130 RepID=A0A921Z5S6_MANSE|nr:uncharacterized protein LOC115444346 [Manduca sexta]KAG6451361.1 hypothetical protein O3G_MSEX007096 [Manduca sexta]KAG6451362.1 hypothetical protein O3G_MSEX007096 [Manduca sexta]KAG6451363.1 hypothetical protein O3G_MSEX007096 [Manduca sexta]
MNIFTKVKLLVLILSTTVVSYSNSEDVIEERSIKKHSNFKFEDEITTNKDFSDEEARQYGLIYQDPNQPLRFPNEDQLGNQSYNPEEQKKKRRRRRRKPKSQAIQNPGYGYASPADAYPGGPDPYNPGFQVPGGVQRPRRRRPKSSIASEAFSSVLSALTSTALYDDKQCVPRMLCEAAGGGALGSSSLLQSVTGLQPLLTLLSAYNGITSSPLFVFGRAVFLGMTSKGNTGTCRYAYPYCPTDPEQLVHYLNNHNGGFFRFFSAPQLDRPHDLEQFYNQLSGQGYGFYQPNGSNQNYNQNVGHQGYGLQGSLYANQNDYGYGFNRAEERIQNKPNYTPVDNNYINDDDGTKWRFPDDEFEDDDNFYDNKQTNRGSRTLKFPDQNSQNTAYQQSYNPVNYDYNRREKNVKFIDNNYDRYPQDPRINDNRYTTNNFNKYPQDIRINYDRYHQSNTNKYPKDTRVNNDEYEFDYVHNFYVKKNKNEDVRTVYVVRGNGDPNHPEIVKVRPGESISK